MTVAVPAPVMPTVPPVLAPPAAVLVSVVEVTGVRVIPWPAKTEDFHDPHIFILSLSREIIPTLPTSSSVETPWRGWRLSRVSWNFRRQSPA